MAEQKTAQQQVREQFKVVENTYQNAVNMWNDALSATTEWTFDAAERGLHYNQQITGQAERVMNETMATYRGLYLDGLKAWQGYVQSINNIFSRTL